MNKISVIVPVYNVENYLEQCLNSIINQSYKDIEIVLVNDGSTDLSLNICQEFEKKDSRIKLINKKNEGLMAAWKTGLNYSTGEYIGFVDSDDWIDENMYDVLIESAVMNKADMVVCQLIRETNQSNQVIREKLLLEPGIYDDNRIKNEILSGIISNGNFLGRKLSPNRVTKLFRRELLINNVEYFDNSISLGEDLITSFACVCDSKKIVILKDFYPYHYRYNQQSITRKYDSRLIEKINLLNQKLYEVSRTKGLKINEQIANDYVSLSILCLESEILLAPDSKSNIIKRLKEITLSNEFEYAYLNCNIKKFSMRYKFYLLLIKYNKFIGLYYSRKIINIIAYLRRWKITI